jgi:hypothetical protein
MNRKMNHLNMDTYELTPIDALAAEAYGPLVSTSRVENMLATWFGASLLHEEAGLVNEDGTIKPTSLTPDEIVTRPMDDTLGVKAAVASLCNFEASVAALLAAAASREGDPATRIREAAIPKDTWANHQARIQPVHPAIVRAALHRL